MSSTKSIRILGAFLALIGPPIVMYLFYFFNYSQIEFEVFIDRLLYSTLFAAVMSLCVMVNLLLFFSFIWINRDEGAQGVLFITILYALWVLGMKLF